LDSNCYPAGTLAGRNRPVFLCQIVHIQIKHLSIRKLNDNLTALKIIVPRIPAKLFGRQVYLLISLIIGIQPYAFYPGLLIETNT
jgi:hypothetical protein